MVFIASMDDPAELVSHDTPFIRQAVCCVGNQEGLGCHNLGVGQKVIELKVLRSYYMMYRCRIHLMIAFFSGTTNVCAKLLMMMSTEF